MWGNYAEIKLNGSNRNASVRVLEIKNDILVTSIPKLNGDLFFFLPNESVSLSFFLGRHVYEYDLHFENVVSISNNQIGYRFRTVRVEMKINDRKFARSYVSQEAIFFNFSGISFAHVLDRSDEGLRIQTWNPLQAREIELNIHVNGSIELVRGEVKWHKQIDGMYQYGLQIC